MLAAIAFEPQDGSLRIEGCASALSAGMSKDQVLKDLSQFYQSGVDHKNGYEWLSFQGLSLSGYRCGLSVCFHANRLTEIHWGIALPDEALEGGWPTRESIEAEIQTMRQLLATEFGRTFRTGQERFPWGLVWCDFDAKGFHASSGIRYAN